jgi:hypothetical protein
MVESGLGSKDRCKVLQVGGGRLQVQLAEPLSLAELVELGRDDCGGALVGGPGEL